MSTLAAVFALTLVGVATVRLAALTIAIIRARRSS